MDIKGKEHAVSQAEIINNLAERFLKDHEREIDTLKECIAENDTVTMYINYRILHKSLMNFVIISRLNKREITGDMGIWLIKHVLDKIGC